MEAREPVVPRVSESLAGRMELLTLYPLSQGEIVGRREGFLDAAFADRLPKAPSPPERTEIARRILRGGFPDAYGRPEARRRRWFASYVTAVLERATSPRPAPVCRADPGGRGARLGTDRVAVPSV